MQLEERVEREAISDKAGVVKAGAGPAADDILVAALTGRALWMRPPRRSESP